MEALGVRPEYLVSQIINFFILLALLWALLYKPTLNMLRQRQSKIKESLEYAEQVRQEGLARQQEFEKQLEQARKEGQEAIARAVQASEKVREEIVAKARGEARQLVVKAQEEIEHDRKRAMAEMQEQIATLSILAAQKVIGQTLDERAHRRLIQEFLSKEMEGL